MDQWLIGGLTVILAIFLAYGIFVFAATRGASSLQARAISIAKEKGGMTSAENFAVVTTNETVYSVSGKDAAGKAITVLIPKNSNQIQVIALSDGVSASSLNAGNAAVSLGLFKNQPIWEVNSANAFKIYDFKTGKELE